MDPFHYIANLDKQEFIKPHVLGVGMTLKQQMESAVPGSSAALLLLLAQDGSLGSAGDKSRDLVGCWAGDRIATVSDEDGETEGLIRELHERRGFREPTSMPAVDSYVGDRVRFEPEGDTWMVEMDPLPILSMRESWDDPAGKFRNMRTSEVVPVRRSTPVWNLGVPQATWMDISYKVANVLESTLHGRLSGSGLRSWTRYLGCSVAV